MGNRKAITAAAFALALMGVMGTARAESTTPTTGPSQRPAATVAPAPAPPQAPPEDAPSVRQPELRPVPATAATPVPGAPKFTG